MKQLVEGWHRRNAESVADCEILQGTRLPAAVSGDGLQRLLDGGKDVLVGVENLGRRVGRLAGDGIVGLVDDRNVGRRQDEIDTQKPMNIAKERFMVASITPG